MKKLRVIALLAACTLAGCADHVRPLTDPVVIDSYCGNGVPRKTALLSILTSIPDMPSKNATAHRPDQIQKVAKAGGGIVAHFSDLNLYSPKVAKTVGSPDEYLHIRTVMVSPAAGTVQPRTVEIEVNTSQGYRWQAFDAYDLQNVCIVGTRKS